jgi:acyl-CoA thioester hydrolase
MRDAGASYARLEERGVQLPVSRAVLEYRRPIGYDAAVRVETRLEEVRSRKVVFSYRIATAEDGATAATARIELVSTDTDGRPIRLPHDVRELLESLQEEGAQSDFS